MVYLGLALFGVWCLVYPLTDYYIRYLAPGIIRRGCLTDKQVCLTFDDGPDSQVTPRILDILREVGIPAVFFMIGAKAANQPELVRQILAAGHELGSHTLWHRHAYFLGGKKSITTISKGKEVLEAIAQKPVIWFRPPWGALNLFQYLTLLRLKLSIVLWTVNAQDWNIKTGATEVCRRIKRRVKPNSIIILHDSGGDPGAPQQTLMALPDIIKALTEKGYRFVTLHDILGGNKYESSADFKKIWRGN